MSESYKDRVTRAMENFHRKDLKEISKLQGTSKKNKKPEKEVEADCLKWMKIKGWDVGIYEAKNVKDQYGNYLGRTMPVGTCDCMGITPHGIAAYVEFKAKGCRSSFNSEKRTKQREFLTSKINHYGFGVVVDSVTMLDEFWDGYLEIRETLGMNASRDYLLGQLPKKRKEKP